jgi:hypothetical protein
MEKMEYQNKDWGKSTCLGVYNDTMIWQAFTKRGGKCSIHHHEFDYNEILVVTGKIEINYYKSSQHISRPINKVVLLPGHRVTIDPKVVHQFEVLESGIIMELYWRDHEFDIVRHND